MTTALALPAKRTETAVAPASDKTSELSAQAAQVHTVLTTTSETRVRKGDRLAHAATETQYVYGDSTPFPHDRNYIELARDAIVCCVGLMRGQHRVAEAVARAGELERLRQVERVRLLSLCDAVKDAMAVQSNELGARRASSDPPPIKSDITELSGRRSTSPPQGDGRIMRAAEKILASTRSLVEGELATVDADTRAGLVNARERLSDARKEISAALEKFLAHHDLPETRFGLHVALAGGEYTGEIQVSSPMGAQATFELAVKKGDAWAEPRRVRDMVETLTLSVQKKTKLFSNAESLRPIKLDRMILRAVSIATERCLLALAEDVGSKAGYQIEVDVGATAERTRVTVAAVSEDGSRDQAIELQGDERYRALSLANAVVSKTEPLLHCRGKMKGLSFDSRPLNEFEPENPCGRIIASIAPTVREIAKRSGAPGELVLRRNTGNGRRDEVFITIAELTRLIDTLPVHLRAVFAPLQIQAPVIVRRDSSSIIGEITDAEFSESSVC